MKVWLGWTQDERLCDEDDDCIEHWTTSLADLRLQVTETTRQALIGAKLSAAADSSFVEWSIQHFDLGPVNQGLVFRALSGHGYVKREIDAYTARVDVFADPPRFYRT